MSSCFGKNGDNLSAKDYSEKKRNLTLFNILRQRDTQKLDLRTNTATLNKSGNIINYNNYENLINYKKGFEECNKNDLKVPYLGQIYKKDLCTTLKEIEKGDNVSSVSDPAHFNPVYNKEEHNKICFNINNIVKDVKPELVSLPVKGYFEGNEFFLNQKKINYTCKFPSINKLISVREGICCPDKHMWRQIGKDIDGEASGDLNGRSVSLNSDGSIVAIGAWFHDNDKGHARVFKFDGAVWRQLGQDLDGEFDFDSAGNSVSLNSDGTIVAVGSYWHDNKKGTVRVFKFNGIVWRQLGQDLDGEADGDRNGISISLNSDGSIVAIGAWFHDNEKGQARVFKFDGTEWKKMGQDLDGEVDGDRNGTSVSLNSDGMIVAVGSYWHDNKKGNVRVFKFDGTEWKKMGQDLDGEVDGDRNGTSVSLNSDGTIVATGSWFHDNGKGQVRVFKFDGAVWRQLGQDLDGENSNSYAGVSVSLNSDGMIVAVGEEWDDNKKGQVRVFKFNGTDWEKIGQDLDGEVDGDQNGESVSLNSDGTIVATGSWFHDNDKGQVRVFSYRKC